MQTVLEMKRYVAAIVFVVALSFTFSAMPKNASADQCSQLEAGIDSDLATAQSWRNQLGAQYSRLLRALGPPIDPIIDDVINWIEGIWWEINFWETEAFIKYLAWENAGCEP